MGRQRLLITECDTKEDIRVSPTFYPGVFNGVFSSFSYQKWKESSLPWQLRVVGGPGSGKTSLATLVVHDLQGNLLESAPERVVLSAFFSTGTVAAQGRDPESPLGLRTRILREIERQLDRHQGEHIIDATNINGSNHPSPLLPALPSEEHRREEEENLLAHLSQSLKRKILLSGDLTQVYLIIDDLDLAWHYHPREYFAFEETLAWLDGLGVKVFATSRTYYRKNPPLPSCDVELRCPDEDPERQSGDRLDDNITTPVAQSHSDFCLDVPEDFVAWWECVMCTEDVSIGLEEINVVCEACRRRGHRCTKPQHVAASLVYKKRIVHLDLGNELGSDMEGLIEHLIQAEHGLFVLQPAGENKYATEYPPLSNLGRQLLPPSSDDGRPDSSDGAPKRTRSLQATRLINLLHAKAENNIGSLLSCMETIQEIDSQLEGPTPFAVNGNPSNGSSSSSSSSNLEAIFELETADRLPRYIVATFDALVERHIQGPLMMARRTGLSTTVDDEEKERIMRTALALHVIRHLARTADSHGTHWVKFRDVKETLLEEDAVCGHGFRAFFDSVAVVPAREQQLLGGDDDGNERDGEDAENKLMDYIVGTTAGLVTLARGNSVLDTNMGFFHGDFRLYAQEGYNSFLASGECC